jgi:hypothetical protein
VGSPGWTQWTPPRLVSVTQGASGLAFLWKAQPGSTNLLEYQRHPEDTNWTILGTNVAAGAIQTATDTTWSAEAQRFYRIVSLPNCHYCCGEETYAPYPPLASETIPWPARPLLTHIERNVSGVTVTWTTEPGAAYVLQCRAEVASGPWTCLLTNVATAKFITVTDATLRGGSQRFYRVMCADPSP